MATHVTDGARRFARLEASPLPRACIALTKSEEKERLLAAYQWCKEKCVANNVEELKRCNERETMWCEVLLIIFSTITTSFSLGCRPEQN